MQLIQDIDLNDIQIFCRAAESKNFTEASIAIGVTPSAVSKAVSRLEKKLNIKLFHRSTRSMRLTEEGKSYYLVCTEAVGNIRDIELQISNSIEPSGVVRVSVPNSYGVKKLLPLINDFLEQHQKNLLIDVSFSNSYINFTKDEFDLAVRLGDLVDDRLVAKYVNDAIPVLVASPQYIAKYGMPESLEDLQHHKCIGLRFSHTREVIPWNFAGLEAPFHFRPSMIHSDSIGAYETVVNGFGIMQFFDYAVNEDLLSGRVIEILPELRPKGKPVHLVYPTSHYMPAKVRVFMDYLLKVLG